MLLFTVMHLISFAPVASSVQLSGMCIIYSLIYMYCLFHLLQLSFILIQASATHSTSSTDTAMKSNKEDGWRVLSSALQFASNFHFFIAVHLMH